MHATSFSDITDMIHLGDLTEGAICRNILLRYNKDKIYVRLFALNFLHKIIFVRHILVQF
jgi:myosin heavy subunit